MRTLTLLCRDVWRGPTAVTIRVASTSFRLAKVTFVLVTNHISADILFKICQRARARTFTCALFGISVTRTLFLLDLVLKDPLFSLKTEASSGGALIQIANDARFCRRAL